MNQLVGYFAVIFLISSVVSVSVLSFFLCVVFLILLLTYRTELSLRRSLNQLAQRNHMRVSLYHFIDPSLCISSLDPPEEH